MPRPLVVRVGDLLREPGSRRDLDRSVEIGPLVGTSARAVPGRPITVVGEVVAMAGGVEVSAVVGFDWAGECRRCLDDVSGHAEVAVREVCQRDPVDEEVLPIDDDLLDLEPLVREIVLGSLPLAPLCSETCPGPDPVRFPTATEDEVDAARAEEAPARDPRWAALDELHFAEDE